MARKHPNRIIVLLALAVALGACDNAAPPDDRVSREQHLGSECENESLATVSSSLRTEGFFSEDFNGDERLDSTYIVNDPEGEAGCRAFLVLETRTDIYSTPVDPSGAPRSQSVPTLNSLAEIDGDPWPEIVVNVEMGASTQFARVFNFIVQGLYPLRAKGGSPGPFSQTEDDLFAFGGSVGHLEAVDCTGDGHVVMSAAIPKGDSADEYVVERRFFDASGAELVLEKDLTERKTVTAEKVDEFPEFGGSPFLSCD